MEVGDDRSAILASASPPSQACQAHDYDVMKPVVLATWKHGFQGACPDKSAILVESQVRLVHRHLFRFARLLPSISELRTTNALLLCSSLSLYL